MVKIFVIPSQFHENLALENLELYRYLYGEQYDKFGGTFDEQLNVGI